MCSIPRRAACNKALRPIVASKLSSSGDVATQTVAFARRFAEFVVAAALLDRSHGGGRAVTVADTSRLQMPHFNALART
jgi:hypothetical protein